MENLINKNLINKNLIKEKYEQQLKTNIKLKLLLFIHILQILFKYCYPYVILILNKSNYNLNIFYIILNYFIIIHWIFLKKECIISYIEKKIINKNYKIGSNPLIDPSIEYLLGIFTNNDSKYFNIIFFYFIPIINFIIVTSYTFKNKYILVITNIIFIVIIIYNLFRLYF